NELFGSTALCYTLYHNYYVPGGLINLINPLVSYLTTNGSEIKYGQKVQQISTHSTGYTTKTNKGDFRSKFVISGIPLNNTLQLFGDERLKQRLKKYTLPSEQLNGAFTMGLVLKKEEARQVLHHQVHIPGGLPVIKSNSVFISFSHSGDSERAPEGEMVASVSTHVPHPEKLRIEEKELLEQAILNELEQQSIIRRENLISVESATPGAWLFWTRRAYGAVGGYPQYKHIKPWQMKDARLDRRGAYLCGDTVYPGQGIVGVCLSGIIAVNKLLQDHR
ncbi:MAG: FAD-dependent oxidoreductase, partial [Pontibacter sp.]|nr:FAD-dependent oxidoreductase [Pontibacter sp.]